MAIQFVCSECGHRLSAPDALLGKKGKCPKCGQVQIIQPAQPPRNAGNSAAMTSGGSAASHSTPAGLASDNPTTNGPMAGEMSGTGNPEARIIVDNLPTLLKTEGIPRRIAFDNVYVILNTERVLAYWKRGESWKFQSSHGFLSARGNESLIPEQGDFTLVEGNVHETDEGHRLAGIQIFTLTGQGALLTLARSDAEILEKIIGRAPLGMMQKRQFLLFLRDHYFAAFTENAGEVIDYLTNEDFHSTQVGDVQNDDSAGLPTA